MPVCRLVMMLTDHKTYLNKTKANGNCFWNSTQDHSFGWCVMWQFIFRNCFEFFEILMSYNSFVAHQTIRQWTVGWYSVFIISISPHLRHVVRWIFHVSMTTINDTLVRFGRQRLRSPHAVAWCWNANVWCIREGCGQTLHPEMECHQG